MDALELLRGLSDKLELPFEAQDWGIVNADAARLNHFIDFFETEELAPTQRFEMGELIIASANEAMREGPKPKEDLVRFVAFIRSHWGEFAGQLKYWLSLTDEQEFPVVALLRALREGNFHSIDLEELGQR